MRGPSGPGRTTEHSGPQRTASALREIGKTPIDSAQTPFGSFSETHRIPIGDPSETHRSPRSSTSRSSPSTLRSGLLLGRGVESFGVRKVPFKGRLRAESSGLFGIHSQSAADDGLVESDRSPLVVRGYEQGTTPHSCILFPLELWSRLSKYSWPCKLAYILNN